MSALAVRIGKKVRRAALRGRQVRLVRFTLVGALGFAVDAAVLAALRGLAGNYIAQMLAFIVAALATWALNRRWTFADRNNGLRLHEEGVRYLGANVIGFVVTNGLYSLLVLATPIPVFACLAIAAAVSALVSYAVNNTLVFKERTP